MSTTISRGAAAVGAPLSVGAGRILVAFGPEHVMELALLGYGFYLSGARAAWGSHWTDPLAANKGKTASRRYPR